MAVNREIMKRFSTWAAHNKFAAGAGAGAASSPYNTMARITGPAPPAPIAAMSAPVAKPVMPAHWGTSGSPAYRRQLAAYNAQEAKKQKDRDRISALAKRLGGSGALAPAQSPLSEAQWRNQYNKSRGWDAETQRAKIQESVKKDNLAVFQNRINPNALAYSKANKAVNDAARLNLLNATPIPQALLDEQARAQAAYKAFNDSFNRPAQTFNVISPQQAEIERQYEDVAANRRAEDEARKQMRADALKQAGIQIAENKAAQAAPSPLGSDHKPQQVSFGLSNPGKLPTGMPLGQATHPANPQQLGAHSFYRRAPVYRTPKSAAEVKAATYREWVNRQIQRYRSEGYSAEGAYHMLQQDPLYSEEWESYGKPPISAFANLPEWARY